MASQSEMTVDNVLDLDGIRAEFPILQQPDQHGRPLAYLDNGASAQKPARVIDCERDVYSRYYANAYRGVYEFGQAVDDQLELTREAVARFIGAADKSEIVFTSGTTMSLNVIASGWGRHSLKPGDEILLTDMEHHANIVPWQMIAQQQSATVKYIPLTDDFQLDWERLPELLTEHTKIVSVTGMSNVLGTVVDVGRLAQAVHAAGAVLVVDAAQSILHQHVDVVADDIDFLTFSGHKLYGPSGVGVMYGKKSLLETMPPLLGGGHMIDRVFTDHSTWAEPPAKFEAGTIPIAQAIALRPAVEFVEEIGLDRIKQHEANLLRHATERLQAIPGLKIYGPAIEHKGAITTFTLDGAHPQDLAFLLNKKGVCVRHGHHCTMPLHDQLGLMATVRASFAVYNTLAEVDQLADAIEYARKRLRLA